MSYHIFLVIALNKYHYNHTDVYIASSIIGASVFVFIILVTSLLVYLKIKKIKAPKAAPLYEEINENNVVQHSNGVYDELRPSNAPMQCANNIQEPNTIKLINNECYGNSLKLS